MIADQQQVSVARRRLVAIMVCDIVASTSFMEADEERAVGLFSACLDAVAATVSRFEGRVFSTAGDALFAEFASPVNALRAAIGSRSALVSVDGASPATMRFGLHLADVVEVGTDLRGDGVNIAARIQSEAEPGEIFASASLVDQLRRNSPCAFDELGERALKGISEPLRLYRVRGTMERFPFQTAPTRTPQFAAPRPLSVAVAPFSAGQADDDDQRYLAEGITEELILQLARHRRLFVVSRSASFTLDAADPVEIGNRLGVRYVVSGTVRRLGGRLRVNIALSDTGTGRAVWTDRMDHRFEDFWDAIDEATARIAATVFGRIESEDIATARRRPPASLDAYESYLRGVEHHRLGQLTDAHVHQAIEWFGRAIEADPAFAAPIAMQICSASQLEDFDLDWGARQIDRALALDPHDAEVNRIMGSVKMKFGDFAAARHFHDRALELAPNDAYIVARCAAFHVYVGEPGRGLELLRRAEELDPFLPVWCAEEKVAAHYAMGDWETAIDVAQSLPFQTRRTRLYRIACLVALGDVDRARRVVAEALAEDPGLTTHYAVVNEMFEDRAVLSTMLARLREAGLPHGAKV